VLKLKFQKLHVKIVNSVNPASIKDFLFQETIIGADDVLALGKFRDSPKEQCSKLLAFLHESGNKQAFVKLYAAIKQQSHLHWLVKEIDSTSSHLLL